MSTNAVIRRGLKKTRSPGHGFHPAAPLKGEERLINAPKRKNNARSTIVSPIDLKLSLHFSTTGHSLSVYGHRRANASCRQTSTCLCGIPAVISLPIVATPAVLPSPSPTLTSRRHPRRSSTTIIVSDKPPATTVYVPCRSTRSVVGAPVGSTIVIVHAQMCPSAPSPSSPMPMLPVVTVAVAEVRHMGKGDYLPCWRGQVLTEGR
ncbi:Os03g0303300 [Oryza sativa Japonica Group]|uniref:Os03g0303300 protein n=1 Tax=Oryza sativa subsp. japonica TaxID=39947 RepID=A0A0P0VXA3_ORYSJ|nr:Os03g0303300 [Oryza sativa Japonica Group]